MGISYHSLILKNDGTLWSAGYNYHGQLGLGDTANRYTFTQVTTNTYNIKKIYCGYNYNLILKNDDTLWACGRNDFGQLGLGDNTHRYTFAQVTTNANDIKLACCSGYNSFILKNDGTLWGCGNNEYGQLGLGDDTNRNTFTQITTNTNNIKQVYCDGYHTFILKNDGTLCSCGRNDCGQLGLGDKTDRTTFTEINSNTDNVKSVCCGYYHTFILKNDGTLWSTGYNYAGQLGLGDTTDKTIFTQVTTNANNIKSVYCGGDYTFILKNDGTLCGCGRNNYGQLGLGDTTNRKTFTQITTNADNIKEIYCGELHSFALKNDGTLWCCGQNTYGQLGLGDNTHRYTFTQVTTNVDNDVESLPNQYEDIPSIIKVYDLNTGLIETLDTNNFKNIPVDKFEKIKVLYTNPTDTLIAGLISFDNKTTWKVFDGSTWNVISDITPNNILLNGMDMPKVNELDKSKLIAGGFTGNIDFRIAMKTKDVNKTPSITKIYIEYKNN